MSEVRRGRSRAGNPHARFDEGEVASGTPRRGSLLDMKTTRMAMAAACAATVGFVAFGDTHTFAPNGTVSSSGWVQWTELANWTNEKGENEMPAAGDDVIITGGRTIGNVYGTYGTVYYRTKSNIGLSGRSIDLNAASKGFILESTSGNPSYWLTVNTFADHDVIYDIGSGRSLSATENVQGGGRIIKKGLGTMTVCTKPQTGTGSRTYTWKGTVIEQGTFSFSSYAVSLTGHQIVFSGNDHTARLQIGSADVTFVDPDLYETNGVANTDHAITSANSSTIVFTGTPKHERTVFTGRLTGKLSLKWAPAAATSELVFSNGVSTTTGQLLVDNGKVRLSGSATFSALSKLQLGATAVLAVDAGGGAHFTCDAGVLADGAKVTLPDKTLLSFTALNVAGSDLPAGVYSGEGADAVPWIEGAGMVIVGGQFETKATWTANGADTLFSTPANWGEATETELPDLVSGSTLAGFGKAGDVATLPATGSYRVYGIEFSRAFSLAAEAGAAALDLGAGGMTFVGTDPRQVNIAAPIAILDDQKWLPGSNWTVNVNAPLSGYAKLTVDTAGTVNFNATSTLSGDVTLSNGKFTISATNAIGGAEGTLSLMLAFGSYTFDGHTAIDRPVNCPDTNDNNYKGFSIADNAVVDFNGAFSIPYKQRSVTVGKNAVVRFNNGFTAATCFQCYGDPTGLIVFDKKPAVFNDRLYMSNPSIEFRAPCNKINGNVGSFSRGTIYTKVPYALTNIVSGTYQRALMTNATIDLCGNDQALSILSGNGGVVTSAAKATMHIVDNEANTETQFNLSDCNVRTNRVKWTGLASLSKEGSYGYWMRAASTTHGDLTVRKGTLGFLPSGSWANATNVTVAGTGVLQVGNKAALGPQADVSIATGAKMALDYAGRMKVHSLTVDGKRQYGGTYGAPGSGAAFTSDLFTGTGILKVSGAGCAVLLK